LVAIYTKRLTQQAGPNQYFDIVSKNNDFDLK